MIWEGLKSAIRDGRIEWQKHSLERMLERGISRLQVKQAILDGKAIEEYPDDSPYPSALFFGWCDGVPLHVVVAYDAQAGFGYIITAYIPDLEHFAPDFTTRRPYEN